MRLIRDVHTLAETMGRFSAGQLDFQAIEQPWNQDMPGHSCVPVGVYTLVEHVSKRLHEDDGKTPLRTWALVNPDLGITHSPDDAIPGGIGYPHRSECLIHPANYANELEGCIAIGSRRTRALGNGPWMVTDSRISFKALREFLDTNTGHRRLVIEDA